MRRDTLVCFLASHAVARDFAAFHNDNRKKNGIIDDETTSFTQVKLDDETIITIALVFKGEKGE